MKKLTSIGTALALIVAASGCANVRQSATVTGWNPVTQTEETRTTTADITTLFTAKQVVQNLTASNTSKTQKLGAASIDQQTSMAELVQLITTLAPLIMANQQNAPARVVYSERIIYTNGPAMIPVFVPGP